ncbi:oxygen-dependent tRNA uridine(34) hydroxylase TrhO [Rubripirellula reticaptiva]|uniref:tRNA uridine(34) hydroxylase n=1 Tax=Rubripirellula reticaptiva TaxID=2528013 RepID=A0A5C6EGI1_9BACT|nr:rhodanese-related sulfurtransferase [Rubripirellula reticaptiva]TWU48102.1 putative rhodanese-related sulfurtransferase [Rubripirellula reticaptiva]
MFTVAALYRFVPLSDHVSMREAILGCMVEHGVRGTLLLASEGINGTVAGNRDGIENLLTFLRDDPRLAELDVKWSECDEMPFRRSRVRLKKEIVTLGVEGIDPLASVGTYVDAAEWNALIDDPDVTLVDTRNDYEVAIGTFRGAINPNTDSFRDFPDFVSKNLDPKKHKKVAMFCTGGIRCEKSTALLKKVGFENVYHLRGGILKYLETVPAEDSRWQGDCFVFDGRVAVDHDLQESNHVMCFGCGWPVSPDGQQSDDYIPGVQCPHCASELTDEQRARFAERQFQLRQRIAKQATSQA